MKNELTLPDRTYAGTDRAHLATAYDYPVEVDGKTMNVNIQGSGNDVVVLLAGRGVTAPSYDMAPLIRQLKDDSTVMTLDFFGSGLSDMTDKPRTSEHIVREVHEVLSKLGVTKYSLVAHSISGVYALHYANIFPSEVKAVVGIDTAVPNMDELIRQYNPDLLGEAAPSEKPYSVDDDIGDVQGYTYSDAEKMTVAELHARNCDNDAVFEAMKRPDERGEKPYDAMRFPENIPVKFFLSSESVGMAPEWYEQAHVDQLTGATGSSAAVLDGGHFLHHTQAKAIAEGIRSLRAA